MLLKDKQIAVIGGGPGGLTLARLLQQQDVNVKVYERDADQFVRQQGSTLDMHYDSGLKALSAAGLMNEFKKKYRPGADKAVVVDINMDVIIQDDQDKPKEDFGNEGFRPEIDRGPLRDILIGSLKNGSIVWDSRFIEMRPSGNGWVISFENGISAYADLVVAADGANSKLRKYITSIPPVYSGATAIEGNIYNAAINAPKLWKLANGGSMFALDKGKTIFFISKGDGTLTYLIGVRKPEKWLKNSGIDLTNNASVAAWFKSEFNGWSEDWDELFASDVITFVARPWYHFPPDQYWKAHTNVTIIGDAAHRIPPYAGEGANQALADALDLYEALCNENHNSMEQAITSFESKMFKRSSVITEESVRNTEAFHDEGNLQFLLNLISNKAVD